MQQSFFTPNTKQF